MTRELALTVTVDDVVFRSEDGRYAVLKTTPERGEGPLVIVGALGEVAPGETLTVRGRIARHASYGDRFQVTSFAPVTPATVEGVRRYLGSGLVPGVGPALAERIVQRFGEHTLEVITTQSARLREVSGIGAQRATAIADTVRSRAAEAEVLSYLHSLGLGPALAQRLRKRYGADTVRVLREDPYLAAEQVRGIGFLTADRMGRALGYGLDDPRRAAGAVLHVLGRAADEGHVFLPRTDLVERTSALDVPALRSEEAIATLAARELVVLEDDAVYAPPLHAAETSAARKLEQLAKAAPHHPSYAVPESLLEGLAGAQRDAVRASFLHKLYVLTGGPGTGKTTTVRALVAAQHAHGRRVLLCAPTGRAAKRLSEATQVEAFTIHRLLEYNPKTGTFQRNAEQPLDADLVLVDEASMIDLILGERLLDALAPGAALILVGDVDQLPPVGAGPLLRELIASGACPVIRLTEVFRQAQRSAIVRAAHAILRGERPEPTPSQTRGDGDYFFVRATEPDAVLARLIETLERMRAVYGLDPKRDVQVLTPMRKGPLGTERLNEALQRALNPLPRGAAEPPPGALRPGDKVMQLRNDYEREVFNGDLGEVEHASPQAVAVRIGARSVDYDRDSLESLTLAYASTIHKVQGSEFPAVLVVLHTTHFMLLSRPLFYTAITRAKKLVVVIGAERALERSLHNTAVQQVYCRLRDRLRSTARNVPA